jgi:multimeric flavodoxin WrbA
MGSAPGPVVFACSPRGGGNSDLAAALFAEGLREAGGEARVVHLRDHVLIPCLGCRKCAVSPGNACVLAGKDDCERLFALIARAPLVAFCSPIFFYHLPAGFKALIDRAQRFYEMSATGRPPAAPAPRAKARTVLIAGRPRGEKLFDGSLLTLKYFLAGFGIAAAQPLALRGLDAPGDLDADSDLCLAVRDYARLAWAELAGLSPVGPAKRS